MTVSVPDSWSAFQHKPDQTSESRPFEIPSGTQPKSDLLEGQLYPALLRLDDATVEKMQYGLTVKIPYDIYFRDSANDWSMVTMTELASLSWSQSGRLVKRLQCINKPFTEESDLSTAFQRGIVAVMLHRKENGYLAIKDVMPCPSNLDRPEIPAF